MTQRANIPDSSNAQVRFKCRHCFMDLLWTRGAFRNTNEFVRAELHLLVLLFCR